MLFLFLAFKNVYQQLFVYFLFEHNYFYKQLLNETSYKISYIFRISSPVTWLTNYCYIKGSFNWELKEKRSME